MDLVTTTSTTTSREFDLRTGIWRSRDSCSACVASGARGSARTALNRLRLEVKALEMKVREKKVLEVQERWIRRWMARVAVRREEQAWWQLQQETAERWDQMSVGPRLKEIRQRCAQWNRSGDSR